MMYFMKCLRICIATTIWSTPSDSCGNIQCPMKNGPCVQVQEVTGQDDEWRSYLTQMFLTERAPDKDICVGSDVKGHKELQARWRRWLLKKTIINWQKYPAQFTSTYPIDQLHVRSQHKYLIKKYLHEKRKKFWSNYIDSFLYSNIVGQYLDTFSQSRCNSLSIFLVHSLKRARSFVQKSQTVKILIRRNKDCRTTYNVIVPLGRIFQKEIAKFHPEGCDPCQVNLKSYFQAGPCSSGAKYTSYKHASIFHIAGKTRLNLTFHLVSIAVRDLENCFIGSLSVTAAKNRKTLGPITYCGKQTNFFVYPTTQKVNVTVEVKPWVSYTVFFTFSVSDHAPIYTPFWYKPRIHMKWNIIASHLPKIHLQVLLLQTQKYKRFYFQYKKHANIALDVFDGPETLSKILHINSNKTFITSMFVCLLHLVSNKVQKFQAVIHFHSVNVQISQTLFLRKQQTLLVDFPTSNSLHLGYLVLIKIETEQSCSVNFTTKVFSSNILPNIMCLYGGISFFDINQVPTKSLSTFCQPISNGHQPPHIYTEGDTGLVAFYYFAEYGFIHTQVVISLTTCSIMKSTSIREVVEVTPVTKPLLNSQCVIVLLGQSQMVKKYWKYAFHPHFGKETHPNNFFYSTLIQINLPQQFFFKVSFVIMAFMASEYLKLFL